MANETRRGRREMETSDMPVGQPKDVVLRGNETVGLGQEYVEPAASDDLHNGYADALAFNEEIVEVMVHETGDQNAENPVMVGVNGQFQHFLRGVPTRTKRKFVDALIVKTTNVHTPSSFNHHSGEMVRVIKQQSSQKYPFAMIHDPNPLGPEWLRRRMAEVV